MLGIRPRVSILEALSPTMCCRVSPHAVPGQASESAWKGHWLRSDGCCGGSSEEFDALNSQISRPARSCEALHNARKCSVRIGTAGMAPFATGHPLALPGGLPLGGNPGNLPAVQRVWQSGTCVSWCAELATLEHTRAVHASQRTRGVHALQGAHVVHPLQRTHAVYALQRTRAVHASQRMHAVHASQRMHAVHASQRTHAVHALQSAELGSTGDRWPQTEPRQAARDVRCAARKSAIKRAPKEASPRDGVTAMTDERGVTPPRDGVTATADDRGAAGENVAVLASEDSVAIGGVQQEEGGDDAEFGQEGGSDTEGELESGSEAEVELEAGIYGESGIRAEAARELLLMQKLQLYWKLD